MIFILITLNNSEHQIFSCKYCWTWRCIYLLFDIIRFNLLPLNYYLTQYWHFPRNFCWLQYQQHLLLGWATSFTALVWVKDLGQKHLSHFGNPVNIYLFKIDYGNIRIICKNCSNLTIKTPEGGQWRRLGVFIVNFVQI